MTLTSGTMRLCAKRAGCAWAHRRRWRLLIIDCLVGAISSSRVRGWRLWTTVVRWIGCSSLRLELQVESSTSRPLTLLTCLSWRYQVLHLLGRRLAPTMSASFVSYSTVVLIWSWMVKNFCVRTQRTVLSSWSFTLMVRGSTRYTKMSASRYCLNLSTISKIIQ